MRSGLGKRRIKRRGGVLQRFSVPFAYVCLFAQLSMFAHFALVRHGICREHGEVIDLDGSHAESHAASAAREPKSSGVAVASQGTEQSSGEKHDHCILAHERRNQNKPPCGTVTVAVVSALLPPIQAEELGLGSLAIYELAPKTSPPA